MNGQDEFVLAFMTDDVPFTNWSAHQIRIWGKLFPTVEHAYQYKKFADLDPIFAGKIQHAHSPWQAKNLSYSRRINSRAWDPERQRIMRQLLEAKLLQHEDVRHALRRTGTRAIIAKGDAKDEYWSIGPDYQGENILGKLWMTLRNQPKFVR